MEAWIESVNETPLVWSEGKLGQHRGFFQLPKVRGAPMIGCTQLPHEERYQIYSLKNARHDQTEIAALLGPPQVHH